jgi:hypothetical protein
MVEVLLYPNHYNHKLQVLTSFSGFEDCDEFLVSPVYCVAVHLLSKAIFDCFVDFTSLIFALLRYLKKISEIYTEHLQ